MDDDGTTFFRLVPLVLKDEHLLLTKYKNKQINCTDLGVNLEHLMLIKVFQESSKNSSHPH